ncbi:uncharacterized protein LOC134805718 [Cydia splendana]|uniref:uncharacterized protein LOC134805718 n=1 Tax=Cydia splendana TaxID=1100963 RepID=UPI00300CB900
MARTALGLARTLRTKAAPRARMLAEKHAVRASANMPDALQAKEVDSTTIRWVQSMLSSRVVRLDLLNTTLEVTTVRGCPQGGVLSPLLWTLAVDGLLHKMAELRIDTQGYADDLVVTVRGNCQKVKYLGVTLDQKLTWNKHVDGTIQKARSALAICCRLAGNRWGLKPKIALWLYTSIVRPIVFYTSVAWYRKTTQKVTVTMLGSLQRTACVIVTGAMSSSPTAALEAILNLPPLHLHLELEARSSMLRTAGARRGNWLSQTLRLFKESVYDIPVLGMPVDTMSPKFCPLKLYSVELPKREDWSNSQIKWKEGSLRWYTDGSKSGSEVGCGVYGEAPRKSISLNLGRFCSIFQAILECASINLQSNYGNHTIYIHSDSQAALLALTSDVTTSRLVENCRQLLNNLGARNKVVLRWVPGHAGIVGNEKADELARAGAKGKNYSPEPFCGIPKSLTWLTLKTYCHYKTIELWRETTGLNHSKALIKAFSKKASSNALALSRNQLRNLIDNRSKYFHSTSHLTWRPCQCGLVLHWRRAAPASESQEEY